MKVASKLEEDRNHKASMRASETAEQTVHRREKDRSNKASNVSVQQAIMSFHADIKNGPDFVCSCCHRLMYCKSVVPCNIPSAATTCWNVCSVLTSDMLVILAMSGCARHVTER